MTNHFEAKKLVLGGLLNDADALSKKVISSYNPDASYKVNIDKMKAHGATYLEACAQFLGFTPRENDKKLYQNQVILCDRMLLKIESLFDIVCDECDLTYRNEVQDEPLLVCRLCMQGCHDCDSMKEKAAALKDLTEKNLLPIGAAWLCHECSKKNDLSLLHKTSAPPTTEPSAPPLVAIEEDTVGEQDERVSPRRGRGDHSDPPDQSQDLSAAHDHTASICRDYIMRKCPHGLTGKRLINGIPCPLKHPPRCRRYCSFGEDQKLGCRRKKECKYFHPKLCRHSELSRTCMNRDCTFVHLKRTKRPPKQSEQQQQPPQPNIPKPIKDPWPPLNPQYNSMGSLSTPYPPTIDYAGRARRNRNNSQSERDNSNAFLEKLLENLKDGIIDQMESKISDLRDQIPSMIQETINWNQTQLSRSRQPSGLSQVPAQPPFISQMTLQPQMTLPPQMPLGMTSYPGSCF